MGWYPRALFINTNNAIFIARHDTGQILIWDNNNVVNPSRTILANLSNSVGLFVTSDEQIFADNVYINNRVDRWTLNGIRLSSPMSACSTHCTGLFVDVRDNLYCSQWDRHQVVRRSLLVESSIMDMIAGTGCQGSTSDKLSNPYGIFVTINFDLYVADCGNNRVQFFRSGQLNATTVAGYGASGTISLYCPTGVVLGWRWISLYCWSTQSSYCWSRTRGFSMRCGLFWFLWFIIESVEFSKDDAFRSRWKSFCGGWGQ